MTIAQQLKVKEFPFEIKDSSGNIIYIERSNGYWERRGFDSNNKQIYFEDSKGSWWKSEFDSNGDEIYHENSYGYWVKCECDSDGIEIYYENSNGEIRDNRPKTITELTMDEIALKFNVPLSQLKIKK